MTNRPRLRRTVAALVVFLLGLGVPAYAFLDLVAGATELSQLIHIAESALTTIETAATAIETAKTVVALGDQIEQDLDQAMGRIGALQQRFEDLSSDPAQLLEGGSPPDWYGDFTGQARQQLTAFADMGDDSGNSLLTHSRQALATADTVSRQRYARVYRGIPSAGANWTARRERAENRLAADYVVLDSAERVTELLASAAENVERSRQATELTETALAQEARANQLTDIEVDIAVAQLTAHHAGRNMLDQIILEREHREWLESSLAALNAQRQQARRAQNRARGRGNAFTQALLLN